MSKTTNAKGSKAKRLAAIQRSQQINAIFQSSTNESEALLSSGGDFRQADDSHFSDILSDSERVISSETVDKGKAVGKIRRLKSRITERLKGRKKGKRARI
jgi:hypothetical protein